MDYKGFIAIDPFAAWRLCEQKKKISPSTASDGTDIKIN